MATKNNKEPVQNKQMDLINILLMLNEYMYQVGKQRKKIIDKITKEEAHNTLEEIFNHFYKAALIAMTLTNKLENPKDQITNIELLNHEHIKSIDYLAVRNNLALLALPEPLIFLDNLALLNHVALLDKLKETIETMDQLVREKYLPTWLDKIYEAIKTLLSDLVALFVPLNKSTQTLTNARSSLFSEIKTLKKSLSPPVSEPQEVPMNIGLPQPRV